MKKRLIAILLSLCMVVTLLPVSAAAANTYNSDWRYWSQSDSGHSAMKSGCRLVSQAKLLVEAGIAPSTFDPDIYFEWCVDNKQIISKNDIRECNGLNHSGHGMIAYAEKMGYMFLLN